MSTELPLILAVIAVISFTASAQEVACAYGDLGVRLLERGNITEYNGTNIVTSTITSGRYIGGSASQASSITVEEIKREIDLKLNVGNPRVRDEGHSLILEYPGDGTINQICSIYEHMVGNWSYARDTRGIEEFQYSNQSLEYGRGKFSGQGDCDDFTILMASLIESIGGTSRIVLAYGPTGGHAYTEVYLGKVGGPVSDVGRMIGWLRKNYKVEEINTHTDLITDDVWLNLDWWREPGGAKHPGGPFFKATSQMPIPTRVGVPPAPLTPVNDPPEALFIISPSSPIVGENASFNASKSRDIGGRIVAYEWDFGDGNKTGKIGEHHTNHTYLQGGPCTVILKIEDDEGAANLTFQKITVNNPPQANFTITPQRPKVGDQVKFDASESYDAEDGENLVYLWELNNNSAIFSRVNPPKQVYDEKGMYWVNLTVSDKNGAKGYKNLLLKINLPPIARIAPDSINFCIEKMINFSADTSEDLDGEIVSYAWDFGDNSAVDYNKTVLHSYHEGGKKTVRLSVRDNDGAINNGSKDIFVNRPPKAVFSFDPQEPNIGEPVSFNASLSSDSDGKILEYSWDFGEGKVEPDIYTSEFAVHAYYRSQKYNVKLTVEDDKGAIGSFSQLVEAKDINNKPNANSFQPDKKSPQEAGCIVTWTAKASDAEHDPILYRFFLNGLPTTDWQSGNQWSWTSTEGEAQIEVQVRDGKHAERDGFDDRKSATFIILPPNQKPTIINFSPDKLSPQEIGSTITWTVESMDADDDPLQFQFSLDGTVMQDWSESPVWSWTATKEQVGGHVIEAKVRDGKHNPYGDGASSNNLEIVLLPNNAPVMSSLTADKEGPLDAGTVVTWTAVASDSENDPIFYKFWLKGPTTGNTLKAVQDWSTKSQWTWANAPNDAGNYTVIVFARDGKHAPATAYDSSVGQDFILQESVISLRSKLEYEKNALKINPYDESIKTLTPTEWGIQNININPLASSLNNKII